MSEQIKSWNAYKSLSLSADKHVAVFAEEERSFNGRSFNGDIPSFARFKADFNDIVVPNNPSVKAKTYVLKEHCLQGE